MRKLEMLKLLEDKVCHCTKCPDLVASRQKTVFGEGDPNARIVLLGEGPGKTEDEKGRPFVGQSGKLLDSIIEACGWKRDELYILNIIKCRPRDNRTPSSEEAANCRPFLDLQLKVIDPNIIVCLGAVAAQNILKTKSGVNELRGTWYNYANAKVRVTFHPAFLLRNQSEKVRAWDDFKEVLNYSARENR